MSLHPTHREHWRARQQTLSQQSAPAATQTNPTEDDTVDVAAVSGSHSQPWQHAWLRLHDMGLDSSHRMTAWRVLHAVLPCGAMLSFWALREPARDEIQPLLDQAMCPHCLPSRTPETLTHMLVDCQVRSWFGLGLLGCGGLILDQRTAHPAQPQYCWQTTSLLGIHHHRSSPPGSSSGLPP